MVKFIRFLSNIRKHIPAVIIFILTGVISFTALAAPGGFRIEQAQAEMPYIHTWLIADEGDFTDADISARLGSNPLTLTELRPFDPSIDSTAYYFIVDCSSSITTAHMNSIKSVLVEFAENMGSNDTMTLITFGVEVAIPLNRETDIEIINEAVSALIANQRGTLFFEGLAKAQELAGRGSYALERKIAFVFSDSDDYAVGSHTRDEVNRLVETGNLPFYALGFDNGSKDGLDYFGELARASGGEIRIVSARTMPGAFNEMLEKITNAWLALFESDSNIISASAKELIVTINDTGATNSRMIPTLFWQPDNEPPTVLETVQLTTESIRIQFSKPVSGASSAESFSVTDAGGNLLGIRAAAYDETDNSVILTFSTSPPPGVLTVEFPGLTDISMEQNKVAESSTIDFAGEIIITPAPVVTPDPPADIPVPEEPASITPWIIAGSIVIVIIAAVVFGVAHKVKNDNKAGEMEEAERQRLIIEQGGIPSDEMQVHFAKNETPQKKIKLNVTDASGQSKVVEMPIVKSIFVGRSDMCDVFFDDKTMSRQHFVIAEENDVFTITNLSQTSSTVLNGVPVQNPRPLQNGDTINAGQQTIVFFILP